MEEVIEVRKVKVANKLRRIVCDLLDLVVVGIGFTILHIPAILVLVQAIVIESTYQVLAMYLVSIFTGAACILFDLVYRIVIPYYFKGKAVGSSLLNLELIREDGGKPTLGNLLKRGAASAFLTYFSFGLFLFAEIVCILFSSTERSFVDVLSGTYYVEEEDERN